MNLNVELLLPSEKTKSNSFHYKRPKDDQDPANSSGKKVNFSLISSCCLTATNSKDINLHSGATRHMSGDESMLIDLRIIPDNSWPVNGIGGTVLYARGIGTMRLVRHIGDSSTYGEVKDVLFVPGLGVNLISIGCLAKSGFKVSFSGLQAIIKQNKTIILTASRSGETLYRADATLAPPTVVCLAASTTVATLSTWHEQLAHVNSRAVHRMASGIGVNGMLVAPFCRKLHESCHGCLLGKMHNSRSLIATTLLILLVNLLFLIWSVLFKSIRSVKHVTMCYSRMYIVSTKSFISWNASLKLLIVF